MARIVATATGLLLLALVVWSAGGMWLPAGSPVARQLETPELPRPDGRPGSTAVVVFTVGFETGREGVRRSMDAAVGIEAETGCTERTLRAPVATVAATVQGLQCARYVSRPYNRLDRLPGSARAGYSVVEAEVVDAAGVVGAGGTLVVLQRTDRWRDWGREWHTGIRIPLRFDIEGVPLVTRQEVAIVSADLGDSVVVVPTHVLAPALAEQDVIEVIRRALSSAQARDSSHAIRY